MPDFSTWNWELIGIILFEIVLLVMGGTLVFAHYLRYKHRLDEMAVVRDRMDPEIDAYNEKTKKEAIQLDIYRQKFFEWRQERRDSTKS